MIEKIAFHLGRKDQEPNIELAHEIIEKNGDGLDEIIQGVNGSDKNIANDCIKVLYEIGKDDPKLISKYTNCFINLSKSRNNRLVWGAMMALSQIAPFDAENIFKNLAIIKNAYEKGSVITVDYAISLFAELAKKNDQYEKTIFPIIIKHLETCRPKEVAQHSERAFICINEKNSDAFLAVLNKRFPTLTEPQKKRVNRLLKLAEEGQFNA